MGGKEKRKVRPKKASINPLAIVREVTPGIPLTGIVGATVGGAVGVQVGPKVGRGVEVGVEVGVGV